MQASAVGRGGSSPSHLNLCFKPRLGCPSLLTLSTSVCPPPSAPALPAVVSAVQEVCIQRGIPPPTIVTESGRALASHHSVLVFDVLTT